MAKVRGAYGGAETRGRVGGVQHNSWRGMGFVKASHAPAQPRSKLQLQMRAWNTYLTRHWAVIDQTARDGWNAYAVTHTETDGMGSTKRLSGLNWFTRCNSRLLKAGFAIKTTAPVVAAPAAPLLFACSDGVLSSVASWTATAGTNISLVIRVFGPHSKGRLGKKEQAVELVTVAGQTAQQAINNLVPLRYTFFAYCLCEDNGLISPLVSDTCDPTAT